MQKSTQNTQQPTPSLLQGQEEQIQPEIGQQNQDMQRELAFKGTSPVDTSGAKNGQENRINQDDDIEADDSMHVQQQGSADNSQRQSDH